MSNKADKTVTVLVERRIMHPVYKKFITRSKKFAAHDAENRFQQGDLVRIRECTPISKSKNFEVIYESLTSKRAGKKAGNPSEGQDAGNEAAEAMAASGADAGAASADDGKQAAKQAGKKADKADAKQGEGAQ